VAEGREVASLLAHTGAPAPEGLWERIAGALDAAPPTVDLAPLHDRLHATAPRRAAPPRSWATRVLAGALAAAAAVIVVLGFQVRDQGRQLDSVRAALGREGVGSALAAAAADPDAKRVELVPASGGLEELRAVVLPDGEGYLVAGSLPALGEGRTYQLWGDTEEGLLSLGVLGRDPDTVVPFRAGPGVRALAVTDEAAPGVAASRRSPLVAGPVT
jgi:Anti-sigma-K factor rskA